MGTGYQKPGIPLPALKAALEVADPYARDKALIQRLLREYNRKLVEIGFGMKRSELKKLDFIDARALAQTDGIESWIMPRIPDADGEREWMVENDWSCFIPCLPSGTIQVNRCRYLYFQILDVNVADATMDVLVQDYVLYEESGWQPGIKGTCRWFFSEGSRKDKQDTGVSWMPLNTLTDCFSKIYRLIDKKNGMKWSNREIEAWEKSIQAYAEKMEKYADEDGKTCANFESLCLSFLSFILKINFTLAMHKEEQSKLAGTKEEIEAQREKRNVAKASGEKPEPLRRTRIIGPLSVTSKQRPKMGGGARGPANYTKEAWQARAHMRTYKSGKKVWIKQAVKRRKSLLKEGCDADIAQPVPISIEFMPHSGSSTEKRNEQ